MNKLRNLFIGTILILLGLGGIYLLTRGKNSQEGDLIKIGIITPLTGDLAYWGKSSQLGVRLAEKELQEEGLNVKFIVEDGKLDPTTALNAAQKLVTVDGVDAIYDEFNPISIPVASYLKDKDIFNLYYSAPVSILADNPNTVKSYLDYEESCKQISELLQKRGVERLAVLKVNLEFGDLCLRGIKNVYGEGVAVQEYNTGDRDVRTQLTKLSSSNPEVVFDVAFQPDALVALKNMKSLGMSATFAGLTELDSDILDKNPGLFEGAILFGMPPISEQFIQKLKATFPNEMIGFVQGAGAPYVHAKQLAHALKDCNKELSCLKTKIAAARPESIIGFQGFQNRRAVFDTYIEEVIDNKFVKVQ